MSRVHLSLLAAVALFTLPTAVPASINIGGHVLTTSDADYLAYGRYLRVPAENQMGAAWTAGTDAAAIKALETDPMLVLIYDEMFAATETFTFADTATGVKEFTLRKSAVAKINEMNSKAPEAGRGTFFWYNADFATDPEHHTAADRWEYYKTKEGKAYSVWFYQKLGGTPSSYDAIVQICTPTVFTEAECYTAICVCIWWGQAQALGKTAFNSKWPATSQATNLNTRYVLKNFASYRLKMIRYVTGTDKHVPGDWLYMTNHNYGPIVRDRFFQRKGWITPLTKQYEWQGENAIRSGTRAGGVEAGKPEYSGLGLDKSTEQEMRDELISAYNDDLAAVIDNGGTWFGIPIDELDPQDPTDIAKVPFLAHKRIHN